MASCVLLGGQEFLAAHGAALASTLAHSIDSVGEKGLLALMLVGTVGIRSICKEDIWAARHRVHLLDAAGSTGPASTHAAGCWAEAVPSLLLLGKWVCLSGHHSTGFMCSRCWSCC
jgi:hypothetical protein